MYRGVLFLLSGSLIALGVFISLSASPREGQSGGADEAANTKQAKSRSKAGETVDLDERLLKEAGIGTDDASLLGFLRMRTPTDKEAKNLDNLVEQLGRD